MKKEIKSPKVKLHKNFDFARCIIRNQDAKREKTFKLTFIKICQVTQ